MRTKGIGWDDTLEELTLVLPEDFDSCIESRFDDNYYCGGYSSYTDLVFDNQTDFTNHRGVAFQCGNNNNPYSNFDTLYNFISSKALAKLFSMYLFDKLLILEKVFLNL